MNRGKTIFAQLFEFLPTREFRRCVEKYNGNYRSRTFSCWDQFLCMAFAQLTYRESLRDIEACLRGIGVKLYHLGIRGKVSRSTLADANDSRDCRIFSDFAKIVIDEAQHIIPREDFTIELENAVYAFDSTTIELCLALFPWSFFSEHESKGGIKAHTLYDIKTSIPVFVEITERNVHDVLALDWIVFEPNAFYIIDRAYLDWERLYKINRSGAFFVIRPKSNTALKRLYSRPVDKTTGVRSDQIVRTSARNPKYRRKYPSRLRRITFFDHDTRKKLTFLTNNFDLPANTIAALYKSRWEIEIFFKWLKQHLRIENFYGYSMNAIKIQIWVAITTYVLVAIVKHRLGIPHSLYTILQVLSVVVFEKMPILEAFSPKNCKSNIENSENSLKQLAFPQF